jgi:DNA repair ATPase RecN
MPLFTRTDRTDFDEEEDRLSTADYNRMRELLDDTSRQLGQVEHINEDLEHRLERQARQHLQTIRSKDNKLIKSNKERDEALSQIEHWKQEYDAQVRRTEATAERLRRVEKELYRMHLQKYNVMNGEHEHLSLSSVSRSFLTLSFF